MTINVYLLLQQLKWNSVMKKVTSTEVKVKLLRFLEIAYKTDGKLTTALVKDKGPFSLSVDNKGNASISGKAGIVKFSVAEEVREYGINFNYVSVMLSGNKDGIVHYRGTFKSFVEVSINGFIDVEQLILHCSGLLCIAARALKNRYKMIDKSIADSLR